MVVYPSFSKAYPNNLETEFNVLPDSEIVGFFWFSLYLYDVHLKSGECVHIEMTSF